MIQAVNAFRVTVSSRIYNDFCSIALRFYKDAVMGTIEHLGGEEEGFILEVIRVSTEINGRK